MDILCTRCGEPWDASLEDVDDRESFLSGKGCPCCINKPDSEVHNINPDSSYIQTELQSILGDDIDGLAATMDDFNLI